MAPNSTTVLPLDIVHIIVEEAWRAALTAYDRRDLYIALSITHPLVHESIISTILRLPVFKFGPSRQDIGLAQHVANQALARAKSSDASEASPKPPYQHAHVLFDFTSLLSYSEAGSTARSTHWASYLQSLCALVPDCTSLTALSTAPLNRAAAPVLLRALAPFTSLTHLHLDAAWRFADNDEGGVALPRFPSVRALRLREYPECRCRNSAVEALGHRAHCLSANLLLAFPGMRALHLDKPVFLKFLTLPPTLETLTLEAPPVRHIAARAPFSTLVGFNVSAALRRGFMRGPGRAAGRRTIVVRTGLAEPYGFGPVQEACAEFGIALRKEVVYFL